MVAREKMEIDINFRVDGKAYAGRQWPCVPRVGEVVFLHDKSRGGEQYAAEVKKVAYYDVEEIRRYGWVRVDIDVEWLY